jgi:serine/threonine protein kinase
MENRPGRPKSALPPQGAEGQGAERGDLEDREQTPLPNESENWTALGATRIVDGGSGGTDVRPDDTALPGSDLPQTLGDFRLLKKIGEGAMGEVWKAHQISFNRDVALKVLFKHIAANEKLVNRFNREARAMGRLDHPNIVRGYGVDQAQGRQFFAMEFVDGQTLQQWLGRLGKLSLPDALAIILTCARALKHAHDIGLIHRDIKPDNVLITRQGDIKITDLGMVKGQDEEMSLTQTGHAVGTPWYMPLEQAKNAKDTDARCDIYALGCMLYCLVTGQPPFTGATLVEVIEAKTRGTFRPARQTNADVPERLDLIISKMTAKLPRDRYQNCGEVIKDLESLGLAGSQLSFLNVTRPPAPSTGKRPGGLQTMTASAAAIEEGAADIWYLRFQNVENQMVVRKLTTAQVLQLIEAKNFDASSASISRQPREGYRALATYKEFQNAALAKVAKSAADEKTVRYRNLYKKIEEKERQRERPAEEKDVNFAYWTSIAIKVGGICLAIGLVIFLLWYFGTGLGK